MSNFCNFSDATAEFLQKFEYYAEILSFVVSISIVFAWHPSAGLISRFEWAGHIILNFYFKCLQLRNDSESKLKSQVVFC